MTHGLQVLERLALPATCVAWRLSSSHQNSTLSVFASSLLQSGTSSGQTQLASRNSHRSLFPGVRRFSALPQLADQQQNTAASNTTASCTVQRKSESGSITASERQASATGGFSTGVTTMATGQGFKKTFYKRKLPTPPSIAFASPEGGSHGRWCLISCSVTPCVRVPGLAP